MTLIVVSGAPATGKSTIAAALSAELRWPLLPLDPLKETLADVLGLGDAQGDENWSDRLGDAAAALIFRLTAQFPDAIAEGWWRGQRRELALAAFTGAVEVFCRCSPELAARRMRDRHGVSRHPIHRDVMNPAVADRAFELAQTVTPLCLGADLIEVDTGRQGATTRAVAAVLAALGHERGRIPPGPSRRQHDR